MPKDMKGTTASTQPRGNSTTVRAERPVWENRWFRCLVSLVVLGHLIAVAAAPFAILTAGFGPRSRTPGPAPVGEPEQDRATEPNRPRPAILRLAEAIEPYLDILYLNHGYSFFAPEPSASYIFEYEVQRDQGETSRGRLPDLGRHWPRLLYHRYFMLASQNRDLSDRALARGKVSPTSSDTLHHAIAKHLNETEGGQRTILRLVIHRLLWPQDVRQGKPLDGADTYELVGEITYPPSAAPEQLGGNVRGDTVKFAQEEP